MGDNRIRMICCDLDGTLLDRKQRISEGNLTAVRMAQEAGIFVTICSGRIPSMLQLFARELKIEGPLIACNGALITHAVTGETIEGVPMDQEDVDRLLAFCRKEELDHSVLTLGVSYFSKNSKRVQRFLNYNATAEDSGVSGIPIAYFEDEPGSHFGETVYKVLVNRLKENDLEKTMDFVENHTGLHHTSSDDGLLDISAMGVSKGTGVLSLA
ncbi:MAG TPA: HAD hydrolase family protein, partial [Clostridiaceae bacterium]|nr:HAD hydrolase family protein [Clostridiaceae bacterium]